MNAAQKRRRQLDLLDELLCQVNDVRAALSQIEARILTEQVELAAGSEERNKVRRRQWCQTMVRLISRETRAEIGDAAGSDKLIHRRLLDAGLTVAECSEHFASV